MVGEETPVVRSSSLISELRRHAVRVGLPMNQNVSRADCKRPAATAVRDPERAPRNIMETTPEDQAATFRNQDQVWPRRVIRRGDAVRPLPPHARSLADLTFEVGDGASASASPTTWPAAARPGS